MADPDGPATPSALELMGIHVLRADAPDEVEETVEAASTRLRRRERVAVLLGQKLIGRKKW